MTGKPNGIDANGNLLSLQYADGTVITSAFDTLDRVTSISGFGASTAFSYDTASRRMSQLNGNKTAQGYKYDQADNLLAMTIGGLQPNATLGTSSRIDFTYGLTASGQIQSKISNTPALMWQPSLMSTTTYGAANDLNQYPSINSASCTYDSNGNLTYDGTNTYTYDYENRLVSVTNTSYTVAFKYDPLDRLTLKTVGTTVTRYIYSGAQRIEEYNYVSGTLLTSYVYGSVLDECLFAVDATTGDVTYLHADEAGSTILCTDSTGTPNQAVAYDPYGQPPSGSLTTIPVGFTGQFYHYEAGIYFYKARHYSPTLGRFLQPDPLGYGSGLNMYEYCGSDPINGSDPLGLGWLSLTTGIVNLVGDVLDAGSLDFDDEDEDVVDTGDFYDDSSGNSSGGHVSSAYINTQIDYSVVGNALAAHQQAYTQSTEHSTIQHISPHPYQLQIVFLDQALKTLQATDKSFNPYTTAKSLGIDLKAEMRRARSMNPAQTLPMFMPNQHFDFKSWSRFKPGTAKYAMAMKLGNWFYGRYMMEIDAPFLVTKLGAGGVQVLSAVGSHAVKLFKNAFGIPYNATGIGPWGLLFDAPEDSPIVNAGYVPVPGSWW